jgi:hypothetical protein
LLAGISLEASKVPEELDVPPQASVPTGLIWNLVRVLGAHTEYQEQLAVSCRAPYEGQLPVGSMTRTESGGAVIVFMVGVTALDQTSRT